MEFDFNPKSVSFTDMNPLQVRAMYDFIGLSIECALKDFEPTKFFELEDRGSELIQIFGGVGLEISFETDD